jgi:serine acetyltransferase
MLSGDAEHGEPPPAEHGEPPPPASRAARKKRRKKCVEPFDAFALIGMPFILAFTGAVWGLALAPSVYAFLVVLRDTAGAPLWKQALAYGITLGVGYVTWGVCVLLEVGVVGFVFRPNLGEGRVSMKSATAMRWVLAAVLHKIAQPMLVLLVPSFFSTLYYKMMGCAVGPGAILNTEKINDCFMVRVGAGSVVGGAASINGHILEKGGLVLAPVSIGEACIIGAQSMIGPGCEIGDGAVIGARAILTKFSKVPPGEVWAGMPAKCIRRADGSKPPPPAPDSNG